MKTYPLFIHLLSKFYGRFSCAGSELGAQDTGNQFRAERKGGTGIEKGIIEAVPQDMDLHAGQRPVGLGPGWYPEKCPASSVNTYRVNDYEQKVFLEGIKYIKAQRRVRAWNV